MKWHSGQFISGSELKGKSEEDEATEGFFCDPPEKKVVLGE
jgi:hypothetical protein